MVARFYLLFALLFFVWAAPAQAVLSFGNDNITNVTDPGTGVPWGNVAEIVNNGGGAITGSAVYLGNRFLLTADHLTLRTHVSFDGTNFIAIDTGYTPVTINPADLKLFKIVSDPGLPSVPLYDQTSEIGSQSTLVGWGVGRDPGVPVNTNVVTWGDDTTVTKRWGTNIITVARTNLNIIGYVYSSLTTVLGNTVNADEAALTTHDSGAALFINDGGTWKLAGIGTATESPSGTSTFGRDTLSAGGTENFFVRITTYQAAINQALPVELFEFSVR